MLAQRQQRPRVALLADDFKHVFAGGDMYHNSGATGISPAKTSRDITVLLNAMQGRANLTD